MLNLTKHITLSGKRTRGKFRLLGECLLLAFFCTKVKSVTRSKGAGDTGSREEAAPSEGGREAGRQAGVLANQHFIFPVNTHTDVTVHLLTLTGGPVTLGPSVAPRAVSLFLPRIVGKPFVPTGQSSCSLTQRWHTCCGTPALPPHQGRPC